jgi:hypothetical protein
MWTPVVWAVLLSLGADAKKADQPAAATPAKPAAVVQCPAWVYFEPHLWSRHIADASPTVAIDEIDQTGPWIHIHEANGDGYIPVTALAPPPGVAPARDAVEAYLTAAQLTPLDAWVIRYEGGGTTGAHLRSRLEDLRSFIRDGYLEAPK